MDSGQSLSHHPTDSMRRRNYREQQPKGITTQQKLHQRDDYMRRKASLDRIIGFLLLVFTSPLILLLAAIVKCTSKGPAVYRQTRVGKDGQTFELLKLRSMVRNAEKPGQPVWCSTNDLRVTRVGRVLRKLHLDELPQLWNVAKGEMSLVGPRPERPEICVNLADEIDNYHDRHRVMPGITGLAQINLPADQTIEDVKRKQILDLRYIEEANLWLDLRMIAATAIRILGISGEVVISLMRLSRREYLNEQFASQCRNQQKNSAGQCSFESVQPSESPRSPR
jgi:lipopolysaccharide/colanic/teichoic acid biosynthesis glycosyltransferase